MTLDKLTMEQLHGSQLEIAEVIGMEAYRKLVASYGGSSIYISKADSVMNGLRDAEIFRRFDGSNIWNWHTHLIWRRTPSGTSSTARAPTGKHTR